MNSPAAARKLRAAVGQLDVVLDLMRQMAEASGIQDKLVHFDAQAAGQELRAALERMAERAENLPAPRRGGEA